ncbi:MAG: efflux RND transporter permease subunit [Tepidisphaerales bacterium]
MHSSDPAHASLPIRIVRKFLHSNLSVLLMILSVGLGAVALLITPREEEPQIIVPLADVFVNIPGRSAREVEQLVSTRLEKLLYQIDGVEYVYSMSRPGQAIVTVRFYVGEDREKSLLKLYNKIQQNTDIVPVGVTGWVVKPIEIDDVPTVTLALTSRKSDDTVLRRVAEELVDRLQAVPNTAVTSIVGGRPRELRVNLRPESLAAYSVSITQIAEALRGANVSLRAGDFSEADKRILVDAGTLIRTSRELENIVVAVSKDRPVYLRDVASVSDGPADPTSYVHFARGPAWGTTHGEDYPAGAEILPAASPQADAATAPVQSSVTLAIAKKKGSNAVWVARDILKEVERLKQTIVPDDMELVVTRNMGVTANHKVNELVEALAVAVLIVIALLTVALGWREAFIVAVAVPIVFALTLLVNELFGYTINRVTLFALILSLGLLVDDPIVDVENIHRHFALRKKASRQIVLEAVNEVRPPLIAATIAVILSFIPMFFITGMMGPYMRPMALNVPVTMLMSMLVSFTITPWLAYHMLKGRHKESGAHADAPPEQAEPDLKTSFTYRVFRPLMEPMLKRRWIAWTFMGAVLLLLLAATAMPLFRMVPLKMLPFDNKNEFQLVLDLPEGSTVERTDAAVRAMEDYLRAVPEIVAYESYAGTASPMDFNGLVRHYYLRRGTHQADIRVILADKKDRVQQSHTIVLRVRNDLTAIARKHSVRLKLVESPPGPPVIATIAAEVYGRPDQTHDDLRNAATLVGGRLSKEPGVVDVDTTVESPQQRAIFSVDHAKAALNGVKASDLTEAISAALGGQVVTAAEAPAERNTLPIVLRLPEPDRSSLADLGRLYVRGGSGQMVPLAELGTWQMGTADQTIYHKNLRPVQYVFAEVAGRTPAEAILDIEADRSGKPTASIPPDQRTFLNNGGGISWGVPAGIELSFSGEGEWNITLDVFRDLGIAFAAAMVGIYILLVHETGSFLLPVVIMLAIPLTILGIMPGFWLLNQIGVHSAGGYPDPVFFTATGMIGMIALAGIVTRDAIILVDFIHHSLARGRSLFDAIMESRVVRLRPILLTAGAAMLGAWPITLDPIFSGLAWALIFGLLASTVFTLFVIPVSYWLLFANKPGHGLPTAAEASDAEAVAEVVKSGATG